MVTGRETQRKGDIAKARAIATFTSLGYDVAMLLTESAAYDLIVDIGGALLRIQCKFCSSGMVDLRRIHCNAQGYVVKKTKANDYDWLYVLTANGNEYLIKDCLVRTYVTMRDEFLLRKVLGNGSQSVLNTEAS